MAELTYTRVGDYYIPNLLLDPEPEAEKFYGKYGDLRREYIREHRTALWASLVNSGRLDDHLTTIERLAEIRMDKMLPQMMEVAGATEELKARDQMGWVQAVNSFTAQAEEMVLNEIVYK